MQEQETRGRTESAAQPLKPDANRISSPNEYKVKFIEDIMQRSHFVFIASKIKFLCEFVGTKSLLFTGVLLPKKL